MDLKRYLTLSIDISNKYSHFYDLKILYRYADFKIPYLSQKFKRVHKLYYMKNT